jgi:hypothetical protein
MKMRRLGWFLNEHGMWQVRPWLRGYYSAGLASMSFQQSMPFRRKKLLVIGLREPDDSQAKKKAPHTRFQIESNPMHLLMPT